jgi:peptide/nickel transport system substrate-binding protein
LVDASYTGSYTDVRQNVTSVDAIDDLTVRFMFARPFASFPEIFDIGIAPRHLLEHVAGRELRDYRAYNLERPVGAGPFKLASWDSGQNVVLERFDGYFEGRPYLDRITFRFVNPSAAVLLLQTGEVDQIPVPLTEAASVEAMDGVTLYSTLREAYELIAWNLRNPLFEDRRVRQALTHAIDREAIVDVLLDGRGLIAHTPITPARTWAYADDVPKHPYDPARARALLAEAGWTLGTDGVLQKDGRRFAFELLTNSEAALYRDVAVIVQQQLREIGVEVSVAAVEFRAMLARVRPPHFEFDALVTGYSSSGLNVWDNYHSRAIEEGNNWTGFSHGRADELIDLSAQLMDRGERGAALKDIRRVLAEEQPVTFLFHQPALFALKSHVRGFVIHPLSGNYRANEWWLDRGTSTTGASAANSQREEAR